MRVKKAVLILLAIALAELLLFNSMHSFAGTKTEVRNWHRYQSPDCHSHTAFRLENDKSGLFFGSCGPCFKSLQWQYDFDFDGTGPDFGPDAIQIKDDEGNPIKIKSGIMSVEAAKTKIKISLQMAGNSESNSFIGNGVYRFHPMH